ncbi:MAG: AtpZ/AtpI family protein [Chitinophagaceae bacterium]
MSTSPQNSNNRDLLKYAGLTTQLFVALGLSVYFGIKLDKWLHISSPVLVWVLPLLVIIAMIYKLVKDTNGK